MFLLEIVWKMSIILCFIALFFKDAWLAEKLKDWLTKKIRLKEPYKDKVALVLSIIFMLYKGHFNVVVGYCLQKILF